MGGSRLCPPWSGRIDGARSVGLVPCCQWSLRPLSFPTRASDQLERILSNTCNNEETPDLQLGRRAAEHTRSPGQNKICTHQRGRCGAVDPVRAPGRCAGQRGGGQVAGKQRGRAARKMLGPEGLHSPAA